MKRLIKISISILLLGGLCFPTAIFAKAKKSNLGQIRKIKLRMQREYKGTAPSATTIEEILKEQNADGSFAGVNYDNEAFNTGREKEPHLLKLATLARGYVNEGDYYQSSDLYDAIARSMKYWVDRNLSDKNWWHRIIGFPNRLKMPLVLMADDLKRYDKELFQELIDYMSYSWSIPKQRAQEGANGTDICQITFTAAVLSENETLLNEVMEKVNSLIKIAHGAHEEGIQTDYSFAQHCGTGRQLYLATYGGQYILGILFFMDFTKDTAFQLAKEKVAIFENLFLEGMNWCYYKGDYDINQYGRGLLRNSAGKQGEGRQAMSFVERMIANDTPRNEELKSMLSTMKGSTELNGNRMFPRCDYMIHRPKGAMISTRMTSIRTVGNEAGNNEGMQNYHMGDGANYVLVYGDEYRPIYAGWNWKRIPGTTVIADQRKLPAPMWGAGGQGGSDYAGGISNGQVGAAAFIYSKDSLKAHKAWFYFDRYYVALGAGISTPRDDAQTITTVNQTAHVGEVVMSSEGAECQLETKSEVPFDRLWHHNVGYRFDQGNKARAMLNAGNYPKGHKGKKAEILRVEINHGKAPQNKKYAYAVYPAIGKREFMSLTKAEYRIVKNHPSVQAVQDIETKMVMAACYKPTKFEVEGIGTFEVDRPCMLMLQPTAEGIRISVASPFGESREMKAVTVSLGEKKVTIPFVLEVNHATISLE